MPCACARCSSLARARTSSNLSLLRLFLLAISHILLRPISCGGAFLNRESEVRILPGALPKDLQTTEMLRRNRVHVLDSSGREPAVQPLPVESVHVSRGMVLELHQYESRSYVKAPTPSPHKQHRRSDPSTNAGAANQVRQDRLNKLKGFQRIATRYEKRAVHYFGMLTN